MFFLGISGNWASLTYCFAMLINRFIVSLANVVMTRSEMFDFPCEAQCQIRKLNIAHFNSALTPYNPPVE